MEKILIASAIVGIELTAEEVEMVMQKREQDAVKAQANTILDNIKANLEELKTLGYYVRGEEIGGCYVRLTNPLMSSSTIHLTRY